MRDATRLGGSAAKGSLWSPAGGAKRVDGPGLAFTSPREWPLPQRRRWPIETLPEERLKRTPKSVQSCFNFCGQHRLGFWTWAREGPITSVTRGCYFCASWRCEGDCQRKAAAVMFARIKEAVERPHFKPEGWVYFVLTIDRHGTLSGLPWKDEQTAYRELGKMTHRFLESLRRDQTRRGERRLKNEWAMVVEAHRSGWPHANLMVYAPELAAELERERVALAQSGADDRTTRLMRGRMRALAVNAGWGTVSTAEQVRSRDALAGYLVKLAGHFDNAVAEVAKLTQVPLNAPPRFRRLRAGKGFLPPKHKSDKVTGTMTVRVVTSQHGPHVVPVQKLRPELQDLAAHCCELEERLWVAEARGESSRVRSETLKLERPRFQVPLGPKKDEEPEALTSSPSDVTRAGTVAGSPRSHGTSHAASDLDDSYHAPPGGQVPLPF